MSVEKQIKKIAVVTDSNSGMAQSSEIPNLFLLPMPFTINGKTYFENINLTQDEFYEQLKSDVEIHTSQPTPQSVITLWEELLQEYDEVIHIPMSSELSGSCQTAMMLAMDFDGRVSVVNNQRISVTLRQSVLDALELIKYGKNAEEIKEILENDGLNSSIYIMLDTLYYLKKGGRITPAAAALGTILNLKPVLQIQGEKLDAYAKARSKKHGKEIMMRAIANDISQRFGGITEENNVHLAIAHSQNYEDAELLRNELLELYPEREIYISPLSLSVACHIGPGALAIGCMKKLDYKAR